MVEGFTAIATDIKKRLMDNPTGGAGAGGHGTGNVKVGENQGGQSGQNGGGCCK